MSLSNWWTKRIRVNKPIDWANTWSLEEQARGISFEMDDQRNLKAVPVVLVDTTMPSIVPASGARTMWFNTLVNISDVPQYIHAAPPAGQHSWICGYNVYWGNVTTVAPRSLRITIDTPAPFFADYIDGFTNATEQWRAPTVVSFGEHPMDGGPVGIQVYTNVAIVGNLSMFMWGYDQ